METIDFIGANPMDGHFTQYGGETPDWERNEVTQLLTMLDTLISIATSPCFVHCYFLDLTVEDWGEINNEILGDLKSDPLNSSANSIAFYAERKIRGVPDTLSQTVITLTAIRTAIIFAQSKFIIDPRKPWAIPGAIRNGTSQAAIVKIIDSIGGEKFRKKFRSRARKITGKIGEKVLGKSLAKALPWVLPATVLYEGSQVAKCICACRNGSYEDSDRQSQDQVSVEEANNFIRENRFERLPNGGIIDTTLPSFDPRNSP
jgi:hypothetical protein